MPTKTRKTRAVHKHSDAPRRATRYRVLCAAWAALLVSGCNYGSSPTVIYEKNGDDAAVDVPQQKQCSDYRDCRDGVFCNGEERCEPNSVRANEKGCVQGERPCSESQICDEKLRQCLPVDPVVRDADNDGHEAIEQGGDDCDDEDGNRYPGNREVCDADHHDEDCDPTTFGALDIDGDGYLNASCCNLDEDENLICGDDCDDANGQAYPGAEELCDGLDNDCNGLFDHPLEDQDGDGHVSLLCGGTDCDDDDPNSYPGAVELCDGWDNDCLEGGGPAPGEVDVDGDGYVSGACEADDDRLLPGDCDETLRGVHPEADEICNAMDDDCNGLVDDELDDCVGPIKQIDVGRDAGCAVRASGTVACWGVDAGGYLGTGATRPHDAARNVLDPREADLVLSLVASVSLGHSHACALHFDGRVSCWGDNGEEGRIGFGSSENQIFFPQEVLEIDDVVELSAAGNTTCALREDRTVWCWGDNAFGQLGNGTTEDSNRPVQVSNLSDVLAVECAEFYTCAILASGALTCWGDMGAGLSEPDREAVEPYGAEPSRLFDVERAARIGAAANHACVVRPNGTAFCFGANGYGQLGNGRFSRWEQSPQAVLHSDFDSALLNVVELAAGSWISQSIEWIWDETEQESVPVAVETVAGVSCARTASGEVFCWGSNEGGALGIGAQIESDDEVASLYRQNHARIPIDGIDAVEIRAAGNYVCVRSSSAEVWCWGGSSDGRWTSYDTPHRITGFED
ncbi:MAG: hypothetical protein JXA30_16210 [Deltaproteobacteria bacterium]|nr:hypothetical protein [Deltaproteobacteria bacterium]